MSSFDKYFNKFILFYSPYFHHNHHFDDDMDLQFQTIIYPQDTQILRDFMNLCGNILY